MADIELIIKIPEEMHQKIKETSRFISGRRSGKRFDYILFNAVNNGTPLPKGHGRLIDAEKLESRMYHEAFETDSDLQKWDSGCWIRYKMFEQNIQKAETIIEEKLESGV